MQHQLINPNIFYFGAPVFLISSKNSDDSINLAPNSSLWGLGKSLMLGLDASSQTANNLLRNKHCVINMMSKNQVDIVDKIAMTTGKKNIPLHKRQMGYSYEKNKLGLANLTTINCSQTQHLRIKQSPIHLYAKLVNTHPIGKTKTSVKTVMMAFELLVEEVYCDDKLLVEGKQNYIDPDKWHPLIMKFRKFYTTGDQIHSSKLSEHKDILYAPWNETGVKGYFYRSMLKLAGIRF